MSDLSAKFAALQAQLSAQSAATDILIDTVEPKLQLLLDNIDTIIVNNAANTKLLYDAIVASSACNNCPTSPLIGTPPVTTETGESNEFCQRVQGLLSFISHCCDYADGAGTSSGVFTTGYVTSVIDEIRVSMDDAGIPYPGWLDTVQIAADGVNFIINRALFGGGAHATFDPVILTLQAAMFSAGSPAAAKAAYDAGIDASGGLSAAHPLLKHLAFGDVVNYYLDPSSTPNVSAFDPYACGLTECIVIDAVFTTFGDAQTLYAIDWQAPFSGTSITPGGYTSDHDTWCITSLVGWTYTANQETRWLESWNASAITLAAGVPRTFLDWDEGAIIAGSGVTAFQITICPPEPS